MIKVPTLYERTSDGRLTDTLSPHLTTAPSNDWLATEKLNGANVRVTVRSGTLVRLEARCNPSKDQKHDGIIDPWYREAAPLNVKSSDYWLWDAANNTNFAGVPNGEHVAEAVGPKIQGNSLELEFHTLYFFSLIPWRESLASSINIPKVFGRTPIDPDELYDWMLLQRSKANDHAGIEGIVWWDFDEPVAKIKIKDYGK